MAGVSDVLENATLDYWLRSTAMPSFTGGTTRSISLHTADPGESSATAAANEVTGGSYARQDAVFNAASGGASALSADVTFAAMPATTVTHFGIWDKAGTPYYIGGGPLSASKTLGAGDSFVLTASGTSVTLD